MFSVTFKIPSLYSLFKISLLSLFLLLINFFAVNVSASLIEDNDYLPADDGDLVNYPNMDEDLKAIIRRTVQIHVGETFGTGFLIGDKNQCTQLITAKHNINYHFTHREKNLNGRLRAENGKVEISYNGKRYSVTNKFRRIYQKWKIRYEALIVDISPSVNRDCSVVPIIKKRDIKNFQNCRIIGFPSEVILDSSTAYPVSSTGYSAIPSLKDQKKYLASKRGVAKCRIIDNDHGVIITDCDSLPGASGAPIVCKVGKPKKWSYVATNNGGPCKVNGTKDGCFSTTKGPALVYKNRDVYNRVYGKAGSFK